MLLCGEPRRECLGASDRLTDWREDRQGVARRMSGSSWNFGAVQPRRSVAQGARRPKVRRGAGRPQSAPRVLINACRSRRELILENLVLRHQLEVLSRAKPKVRLRAADRVLWVWLRRVWPGGWADHLRIVRPATVIGWHRKGWRLYWTWRSRTRLGRPRPKPRGQGIDRSNVAGECAVGHRADPGRVAQARNRG